MKNLFLFVISFFVFGTTISQTSISSDIGKSPNLNFISPNTQIAPINREIRNSGGGCNIGNEVDPGWAAGNFSQNFLLGVKFTLSDLGTLNSINMIGNGSGSNIQMAVYDDNAGVPNDLVISSGVTTVGTGVVTLPVTPTQLIPGDYWIMAVYQSSGNHSNVDFTITGNVVYYTPLNFGDPIPNNASGFISYENQDFLYFLDITCVLGVNDTLENRVSVFPNPVEDLLLLNVPMDVEITNSTLYDISGKNTGIKLIGNSINTSSLEKGIYLLSIETSKGSLNKKIIKN